MKILRMTLLHIAMGLLAFGQLSVRSQGFVNLNFERATVQINNPTYGWLDWGLAAPGWSHSSGTSTSWIYYGSPHTGVDQIYLLRDATSPVGSPGALAGNYSLAFASGLTNGADFNSPWVNAYISQTGLIPSATQSIQLLATGPFQVFVGGSLVPMQNLGGNVYAGNVSALAGTVEEVRIVNTAPIGYPQDFTVVDNITFSPAAVPEPCHLSLCLLGLGLLFCRPRAGRITGTGKQ